MSLPDLMETPHSIRIKVKRTNRGDILLSLSPKTTIRDIKELIQMREGVPIHQQRLVQDGRPLEDDYLLSDRNICDGSSLRLLLRLRGGMQITVKTLTGHSILLNVEASTTVHAVKTMINDRLGMPIEQQCLVSSKYELMENDSSLSKYDIDPQSVIYVDLWRHKYMQILCNNPFRINPAKTFNVGPYETICDIKKKIGERSGDDASSIFLYLPRISLKDDMTLAAYSIAPGTTLYWGVRNSGRRFEVGEVLANMTKFWVVAKDEDVVLNIKNAIMEKRGFPIHHQRLVHAGKTLPDDYNVNNLRCDALIHLVIKPRAGYSFSFSVKTMKGKIFLINVHSSDTIQVVKMKILAVGGILVEEQLLYFGCRYLTENAFAVTDYDIGPFSSVLVFPPYFDMIIYVRVMMNAKFPLNVSSSTTIDELISLVVKSEGISASSTRFFYNGVPLDNGHMTLIHYNIAPDSIVNVLHQDYNIRIFLNGPNGDMLNMRVASVSTVDDLKRMISAYTRRGSYKYMRLHFGDKVMSDCSAMLSCYNVVNGSTLSYNFEEAKLQVRCNKYHVTVGDSAITDAVLIGAGNLRPHISVRVDGPNPRVYITLRAWKESGSVDGTYSYDAGTQTNTFVPHADLEYGTSYDIEAGCHEESTHFRFSTVDKRLLLYQPSQNITHSLILPPGSVSIDMLKMQCCKLLNYNEQLDSFSLNKLLPSGSVVPILLDEHVAALNYKDVVMPVEPTAAPIGDAVPNIAASELEMQRTLHNGVFATVHTATWRASEVAVKIVRVNASTTAEAREALKTELNLLSKLRHPHILTLMGICRNFTSSAYPGSNVALVTEFMTGGSLHAVLHDADHPLYSSLTVLQKYCIVLQIISGMAFLHQSRVIHRDVKPANVLINENASLAKIADFGLSSFKDQSVTHVTAVIGTVAWTAPEVLEDEVNAVMRRSADVYGFGVMLWELSTGRLPWEGLRPIQIIRQVGILKRNVLGANPDVAVSEELRGIIARCLSADESIRPTFADLRGEMHQLMLAAAKVESDAAKEVPDYFICPIGFNIMEDPVICSDGNSYDRNNITEWLTRSASSPMTNLRLEHVNLVPNRGLKAAIDDYLSKK